MVRLFACRSGLSGYFGVSRHDRESRLGRPEVSHISRQSLKFSKHCRLEESVGKRYSKYDCQLVAHPSSIIGSRHHCFYRNLVVLCTFDNGLMLM